MEKNDDLVGHHDDSCGGHDMLYPESRYSKTPPAHRNKQQTYVGSSLADFHVASQL
jgi:hypothetical protein